MKRLPKRIYYKLLRILNGKGYVRADFGHIAPTARIGKECALVPANMYLDDFTIIQNRVNFISLHGTLTVKKFSVISSQCIIVPDTHLAAPGIPFFFQADGHFGDKCGSVNIDEDCWVGAGAILLNNCHLQRGSVVAAGAVVNKEFPPYAVIAGVPARIIGVKFDKDDILKHEQAIYPPEQRMSAEEIDRLYDKYYTGMNPMKKCEESEYDRFRDYILSRGIDLIKC